MIATITRFNTSRNPANQGEAITLAAQVVADPYTAATYPGPTGSVTFKDGADVVASVSLQNFENQGLGSININTLSVGSHSLTAEYSGDATYSPSVSDAVVEVIGTDIPPRVQVATSTSLSASPNPATVGDSVTLSAKVTPSSFNEAALIGQINFKDGSTSLGSPMVDANGQVSINVTPTQGSHSYTATYRGDVNYLPSTSSAVVVVVNAVAPPPPPPPPPPPGHGHGHGGHKASQR